MAMKVIISNSDACFKVVGVCLFVCLFPAMACINLVFFHQKTKDKWDPFTGPKGNLNAAFSRWIPSVLIVQFTEQMAKLNRLTKTYQIVFVVGLKIHSPFYNEKIVWENSERNESFVDYWFNCKKVSRSLTFRVTFCQRLKFIKSCFLGRVSI